MSFFNLLEDTTVVHLTSIFPKTDLVLPSKINEVLTTSLNQITPVSSSSDISYAYYLKDIKLIEDNLEFRFGNYKNALSPVVFTYSDLIKSPQGKLIK